MGLIIYLLFNLKKKSSTAANILLGENGVSGVGENGVSGVGLESLDPFRVEVTM
jgi:hypothetical protein